MKMSNKQVVVAQDVLDVVASIAGVVDYRGYNTTPLSGSEPAQKPVVVEQNGQFVAAVLLAVSGNTVTVSINGAEVSVSKNRVRNVHFSGAFFLVGMTGLEPATSASRTLRATICA